MARALSGWLLALGVCLPQALLGAATLPPRALSQAAYVWQRDWHPGVQAAVRDGGPTFERLICLAAEISWQGTNAVVQEVFPDASALQEAHVPIGPALHVQTPPASVRRASAAPAALLRTARQVLDTASLGQQTPAELQIDYDCPESSLAEFGSWLGELRRAVAPTPVTFTALPAWLKRAAFAQVAAAADGFVLQVHSFERPRNDRNFTLCDPDAANRAVAQASRLGRPFRVALPTYGYQCGFGSDGRFLGLWAEGDPPAWPPNTRVRELRADPAALASLVRTWTSAPPPAMAGIVWYRLPIQSDRRNWSWTTLEQVRLGLNPVPHLQVLCRLTESGLSELVVTNGGAGDASEPPVIRVAWPAGALVAADGLAGFRIAGTAASSMVLRSAAGGMTLAAHTETVAGWVRLTPGSSLTAEIVAGPDSVAGAEPGPAVKTARWFPQRRVWAALFLLAAAFVIGWRWRSISEPGCPRPSRSRWRLAPIALVMLSTIACGPFLPSSLIDDTGGLLRVPEVLFRDALARQLGIEPRRPAGPGSAIGPRNAAAVDVDELRDVLTARGEPSESVQTLVARYAAERARIQFRDDAGERLRPAADGPARIVGERPEAPPGVPAEFAGYFTGAVAWHEGRTSAARAAWESVLHLSPAERRHRSTWAAFMLGRSWEDEHRAKAIDYFQLTRALCTNGCADSLGLAVASLGYEGRLHLREGRVAESLRCYAEQAALHEPSAMLSLRAAAALTLQDRRAPLAALTRDALARTVLTTYVASLPLEPDARPALEMDGPVREAALGALERTARFAGQAARWHRYQDLADRWLLALEKSGVQDVRLAELIALTAYQRNQMEQAGRWLRLAPASPGAQWLRARLLLRDGAVEEAGGVLASLCRKFPAAAGAPAAGETPGLAGSVYVSLGEPFRASLFQQAHGEYGALLLARRDYADALHALMLAGYWPDAAYVAERVLTSDELGAYLGQRWPADLALEARVADPGANQRSLGSDTPGELASRLRHLLARRLAREGLLDRALPLYPEPWREAAQRRQLALARGLDPALPKAERARDLLQAARLTREYGLELLGTEGPPDFAVWGGNFDFGITPETRASFNLDGRLRPSAEEVGRANRHAPANAHRWHYRWVAADLAWQAAALLPDNSDETAQALCLGGTWIKNQDPQGADRFYKALVRRCRKTTLGAEAERRRWFPSVTAGTAPATLGRE